MHRTYSFVLIRTASCAEKDLFCDLDTWKNSNAFIASAVVERSFRLRSIFHKMKNDLTKKEKRVLRRLQARMSSRATPLGLFAGITEIPVGRNKAILLSNIKHSRILVSVSEEPSKHTLLGAQIENKGRLLCVNESLVTYGNYYRYLDLKSKIGSYKQYALTKELDALLRHSKSKWTTAEAHNLVSSQNGLTSEYAECALRLLLKYDVLLNTVDHDYRHNNRNFFKYFKSRVVNGQDMNVNTRVSNLISKSFTYEEYSRNEVLKTTSELSNILHNTNSTSEVSPNIFNSTLYRTIEQGEISHDLLNKIPKIVDASSALWTHRLKTVKDELVFQLRELYRTNCISLARISADMSDIPEPEYRYRDYRSSRHNKSVGSPDLNASTDQINSKLVDTLSTFWDGMSSDISLSTRQWRSVFLPIESSSHCHDWLEAIGRIGGNAANPTLSVYRVHGEPGRYMNRFLTTRDTPNMSKQLRRVFSKRSTQARALGHIWAEILWSPQSAMADVSIRNDSYPKVIDLSGTLSDVNVIHLRDLVILDGHDGPQTWCTRNNVRVIPSFNSPYDVSNGCPKVVSILLATNPFHATWSMPRLDFPGVLSNPGLKVGNIELLPQTWIVPVWLRNAIKKRKCGHVNAVDIREQIQDWKLSAGIPRFVRSRDYESNIIDMESPHLLQILSDLPRELISLCKDSFLNKDAFTSCEGNSVTSEFISHHKIVNGNTRPIDVVKPEFCPKVDDIQIHYGPVTKWITVTVIADSDKHDVLLRNIRNRLANNNSLVGSYSNFHFVRYDQPHACLRLRYCVNKPLPFVNEIASIFNRMLSENYFIRWSLDTYIPEVHRYGMGELTSHAEDIFSADTELFMRFLGCRVENIFSSERITLWACAIRIVYISLGIESQRQNAVIGKRLADISRKILSEDVTQAVCKKERKHYDDKLPRYYKYIDCNKYASTELTNYFRHELSILRAKCEMYSNRYTQFYRDLENEVSVTDSVANTLVHMISNRMLGDLKREYAALSYYQSAVKRYDLWPLSE